LENTTKLSGIDTHNYSIDALKKSAFIDEINNVLIPKNSIDQLAIIYYLENRIKEIDKKYK
jgi:hypothetical protein